MTATSDDRIRAAGQPVRSGRLLWDEDRFQRLVRDAAKRKGLTLTEVARLVGSAPSWLQTPATKTGRGVEKILQIAGVLDIDPAELLGRKRQDKAPVDSRLQLVTTIATVTAHLAVALQSADEKDSAWICKILRSAIIQGLKEIDAGSSGNG